MEELVEKDQIIQVLNRYAQACDQRQWALLNDVFMPNVLAQYGGFEFNGCAEIVSIIRNSLGGCGPSQHQLSNYMIEVKGDKATSCCLVRASHAGGEGKEGLLYEVWGEYKDTLVKHQGQWRISKRQMVIIHEIGTRNVLAPEPDVTHV